MADFEVYQDPERAKSSRGRKAWSFRLGGQESLYWCPTEAAARRVVSRLMQGRSGEAFGGNGVAMPAQVMTTGPGHPAKARGKVVAAGEVVTETVVLKSGTEKPREKRPSWIFELDGKADECQHQSQDAAKAACAKAAFFSRGRLGRFAEAEAAFADQFGTTCKVQVLDLPGSALHRKIVAKDADGGLWHVGFAKSPIPGGSDKVKFVLVVPAPPK